MALPSGISVGLQLYDGGLDLAYWTGSYLAPKAGVSTSSESGSRYGVRTQFLGIGRSVGDGMLDVGYETIRLPVPESVAHVSLPLWLPAIVLSIAPARLFLAARRAHQGSGDVICGRCGYNLRGNVTGVCPECGTEVQVGLVGHGILRDDVAATRRS